MLKSFFEKEKKNNPDIVIPYFPQIENYNMESFESDYINSQIMKRLFKKFQQIKLKKE